MNKNEGSSIVDDRYKHLDQTVNALQEDQQEIRQVVARVATNQENQLAAINSLTQEIRSLHDARRPQLGVWVSAAMGAGAVLLWVVTWGMAPLQIEQQYIASHALQNHNSQEKAITALDTVLQREMRILDERQNEKLNALLAREDKVEKELKILTDRIIAADKEATAQTAKHFILIKDLRRELEQLKKVN